MNPLQELQAIITGLLFRIGDEQVAVPEHASLVLVVDGKVTQYTVQAGSGSRLNIVTSIDVDVTDEGDEDA